MRFDDEFSDLVGSIYDCALDHTRWPAVLGQICEAVDANIADLTVFDAARGGLRILHTFNMDEDFLALTRRNAHLNPLFPLGLVVPPGEPFCASREIDLGGMHNSLYYRNCRLAERGQNDVLAVPIERSVTEVSYWGVYNQFRAGTFRDEHIAFARAVTPHIKRALRISGVLDYGRVAEASLRGVLATLPAAALIVAEGGQIRFANPAALAELAGKRLIAEARNRLWPVSPGVAEFLRDLYAGAKGRDILVEDESGRRLHVTGVRLDGDEGPPGDYLIVLRSPDPDMTTPISAAARFFALTISEVQVLKLMVDGLSLEEAASMLGLARSTVKSHLDALYAKCGVNSRAKLAGKIAGLISPVST